MAVMLPKTPEVNYARPDTHSPVQMVTSKLLGSPLIVISVLLLASAIVPRASDFLAWIKNQEAGSVGSLEKATSNLFSCK